MSTKTKVIIGIPSSGRMMDRTAVSLAGITLISHDVITDVILKQACDVVSSRTAIVQEAVEKGATHLLFMDTDMIFPSDILKRLLANKK